MESYSSEDLAELLTLLHGVRAKWKNIAIQLGLPKEDIDAIASDNNYKTEDCLTESITVWLKGVEPTREQLAKALQSPTVGREDIALTVHPNLKKLPNKLHSPHPSYLWPVLLAVVAVLLALCYYQVSFQSTKESLSLPVLKQELIGRDQEMKDIMDSLHDDTVDAVTLFGQAGFGKSEVALHVGHRMVELGVDVHYIKVEGRADVASLERALMEASDAPYDMGLMKWAKGLTKRTLLILDNVDGRHWVRDESRQQFQTEFLDILLGHSSVLQVLITSQQDIGSSKYKFRSYKMHSLSTESCIRLVNVSVSQGAEVNTSDSKAICDLVGNVPLAIKVLSAILSPPVKISVSYVIQRLNETAKKLKFMANSGDRVDKDRLLSAIELAFEFIKPEYQICSLLLVKLPGSFSLDMVSSIVTSDMFEDWEDFNINDCLYDLSAKSFLEQVSFESLLTHKQLQGRYHFHVLIRDYLESSKDNYNISKPLKTFWKNYLEWLSSDHGEAWLIEDLGQEDVDALLQILNQEDTSFSYSLATSLSSSRLFIILIESYFRFRSNQNLLITIANILVSDCKLPGVSYPVTSISTIINAYLIVFEELVCREDIMSSLQDCMDKLILCQPKIEQLHKMAKGDYKVMEASSSFHNNLVELKCLETKNSYCEVTWKYRLLGLAHMLVMVRDSCLIHCSDATHEVVSPECSTEKVNSSILLGLESYSLIEDDEAINYLHLSLKDSSSSSCGVLQDSIAFITLYAIHSRQDNLQGMEESLAGILKLDFEDVNMTCYTSLYGDIVIPFLQQVNEIKLSKKLRSMRIDSILEAVGNCEDDALNCQTENRYKPFMVKTLARFAPLWVKKMLTQNTPLFCSVSKAVMTGCESPFPEMITVLRMQEIEKQSVFQSVSDDSQQQKYLG